MSPGILDKSLPLASNYPTAADVPSVYYRTNGGSVVDKVADLQLSPSVLSSLEDEKAASSTSSLAMLSALNDLTGGRYATSNFIGGGDHDETAYSLAQLLRLRMAADDAMNEQRLVGSWTPYLLVLASVIFLLSLVANVLVIISVFRSRRYRATSGLLALNLTVADLLITVILLPLWMVQQNLSTNNSYVFSIIVCKIHPALLTMSVGASAYTLVALSVDRMCIVRLNAGRAPPTAASLFNSHDGASARRMRRTSLVSWLCCCRTRWARIAIVATPWLLSLVVSIPVMLFRTVHELPQAVDPALSQGGNITNSIQDLFEALRKSISPESSCREDWPIPILQTAYDFSLLVVHFAVPALVQLCLYIYLGWVVSRLTSIPASRNSQASDSNTTMTLLPQQQTMTDRQQFSAVAQQTPQPGRATAAGGAANSPPLVNSTNVGVQAQTLSNNQNGSRPTCGSVSVVRRQRAWRTLIALSVLFPISWLPYYILYTYLVNADPAAIGPRTSSLHTLLELFAMLGFSNSAQNAIVYCATDDRLRGSVKSLLSMIPCVYRWNMRHSRSASLNGHAAAMQMAMNNNNNGGHQQLVHFNNGDLIYAQGGHQMVLPNHQIGQQQRIASNKRQGSGNNRRYANGPSRNSARAVAPSQKIYATQEERLIAQQQQQQQTRTTRVSSNKQAQQPPNQRLRKHATSNSNNALDVMVVEEEVEAEEQHQAQQGEAEEEVEVPVQPPAAPEQQQRRDFQLKKQPSQPATTTEQPGIAEDKC